VAPASLTPSGSIRRPSPPRVDRRNGEAQKKEKAHEVAATAAMMAPAATAGADASSSTSETKATVPPTPKRPDSGITVLCLPAHNEADEIVGLMLAQL